MFLEHLYLRNIRCFRELDLSLTTERGQPRKWTLLLGENGAGKSTVLRSIALLMAGSDALASLIGDTDSWIRFGANTAEIRAILSTAKDEEREISLRFERGQSIREMFDANRESLDALDRLGFYVLALESQIRRGIFEEQLKPESIQQKARQRVDAYAGERDDWYAEWFQPTLARIDLGSVSWENLIGRIGGQDTGSADSIQAFYARCIGVNR